MKYAQQFKLFNEIAISSFLRTRDSQVDYAINNAEKNEILNADPEVLMKNIS